MDLRTWQTRRTCEPIMTLFSGAGRLVILSGLLALGLGLIWYVGHHHFGGEKKRVLYPELSIQSTPSDQPMTPRPNQGDPALTAGSSSAASEAQTPPDSVTAEGWQFAPANPILFNSGASTLRDASMLELDKIALWLEGNPDITLEIIGHADTLGIEAANQRISADRAAEVEDYLISQGIDRLRLRSAGVGSLNPVASNDTRLGRQANRRVELLIVKPGAAREPLRQESGK